MVNGITNKMGNTKTNNLYFSIGSCTDTGERTYKFTDPFQPIYVGAYRIGGETGMSISFSLSNKPSWINRQFCKWCLGWEWIENN